MLIFKNLFYYNKEAKIKTTQMDYLEKKNDFVGQKLIQYDKTLVAKWL